MTRYDYKVIPAPAKGQKVAGIKTHEGRFANTVEGVLNMHAARGWEYLRSDILPSEERSGLTGTHTVYRTLLVFRRAKAGDHDAADDMIQTAQSVAETVTPDAPSGRREPSFRPIQPSRADPPETPERRPDRPDPDTPPKE